MIVVHPYDPSTVMLKKVYEGLENVTLFDSWKQRKELLAALAAAPREEPVLLLGHGCPYGLYDMRYGLILNDTDAELLKDRPNLIGIWCYASDYAAANTHAWDFARRLGDLLREGAPLETVAKELMNPKYIENDLTRYNYTRLTWRPTGKEPLPEAWDPKEVEFVDYE